MAFSELKITSGDTTGKTISELDDVVTGQAQSLKARFDAMDNLQTERFNSLCDMLDSIYPVGAIYMSLNADNPSAVFGGTWEKIEGKFLIGSNDTYPLNSSGGTVNHKHTLSGKAHIRVAGSATHAYSVQTGGNWTSNIKITANGASDTSYTGNQGVSVSGEAANASSLPPYLSVNIWKRTA